jgi:DHA3 family macrolide efflux protein-like MFS transporter
MDELTQPKKLWNRNFILLLQGHAVSIFGDVLYAIAIGYWVYEKTGSTALMGMMSSISMFVSMFLGPFAGAIIDRSDRKMVLVGMDVIRGVLMVVVGIIAIQGKLGVPMILITAFIAALCGVFFNPATMTVFVDVVPKSDLVRAQSLYSGSVSLVGLIGKGVSGALLVIFGIGNMIIINGISFLFSAFTVLFIRVPQGVKQGQKITVKHVLSDVAQGAKDALATPGLNTLIICALIANLLGSGYMSLLIPLALQKGLNMTEYGLFMAASSLAAVLGMGFLGIVKIPAKHKMKVFVTSFALSSMAFVVGLSGYGFVWLTIAFFVGDFLNVIGNAILNATMILAIPREKRATIFGFVSSFSIAGMALSTLAYGFLAERIDLSVITIIGTVLSFFAILPVFLDKGIIKMITSENQ